MRCVRELAADVGDSCPGRTYGRRIGECGDEPAALDLFFDAMSAGWNAIAIRHSNLATPVGAFGGAFVEFGVIFILEALFEIVVEIILKIIEIFVLKQRDAFDAANVVEIVFVQVAFFLIVFDAVAVHVIPFFAVVIGDVHLQRACANHLKLHAATRANHALANSSPFANIEFCIAFDTERRHTIHLSTHGLGESH
jgi:hypothetical protein